MDLSLIGKQALVCGSTQGIGKATAIELTTLGANVTLVARNEARLKATIAVLDHSQGQQHDYVVADFSQPDFLKSQLESYSQQKKVVDIFRRVVKKITNRLIKVKKNPLDSSLD